MSSKPKQSEASKELERISIQREKDLRVENARQTTRAFSDNIAFRKKLRGIFSLLSNGFKGFPNLGAGGGLGTGGGRDLSASGGARGGASSATAVGGVGRGGGSGGLSNAPIGSSSRQTNQRGRRG